MNFYVALAENSSSMFYSSMPRKIYFDLYTKPDSLNNPIDMVITVPNINEHSHLPIGSVCGLEIIHIGRYISCLPENEQSDQTSSCPYR